MTWKRKDFPPYPPDWPHRKKAEEETSRDLQKPIEQLLCDVHEELLTPNRGPSETSLHANKRMVALIARAAIENRRSSAMMLVLTIVIAILTGFLAYLEFAN
jgi:hypothetical protein